MADDDASLSHDVVLPGSGDTPEENARNRLKRSLLLFAADGYRIEELLANLVAYEAVLENQVEVVKKANEEVSADVWCARLEVLEAEHEATQRAGGDEIPAWVYGHFAVLDCDLRDAVSDDGFDPLDATALYSDWVDEKKHEFEEANGLPEDWVGDGYSSH